MSTTRYDPRYQLDGALVQLHDVGAVLRDSDVCLGVAHDVEVAAARYDHVTILVDGVWLTVDVQWNGARNARHNGRLIRHSIGD
jgi:hypothetical protein